MAELADALVLGTSGQPCRFKSCYPHQIMIIRTRFQSGMASGFYLGEKQKRRYHECPSLFLYDPFLLSGSLALCPFHFSSFSLSRCQTVCHRASFSFLVFGGLNIHHSTTDEALFKFSTSPAERVAIPFAFAKVAKARQRQSLRLCRCFSLSKNASSQNTRTGVLSLNGAKIMI